MILIISSSLNHDSNSRILALEAKRILEVAGQPVTLLDLRERPLPFCDGDSAYQHPNVGTVEKLIAGADAVLLATPIYNFDASAAAKNLVELTGGAWEDKIVGFLCAAGGASSYMSVMAFANSLMLDFRCVIVPRFVYATGGAFASGRVTDAEVVRRIEELCNTAIRLTRSLEAA